MAVLEYRDTNGQFKKLIIPCGSSGGTSNVEYLSDIKDVKITNPEKDQILVYDDTTKTWINKKNGAIAELPNNIAYITNSSETKEIKIRANQHNYSTEEQIIGTWIDGKPLYEKVINGTMIGSPSNWTNFYDCSNLNIDNMITIKGFFNYNNERNIYIDSRYASFSYVYNTKFIQYYNTGLGQYNFETTLIIQYTKTTD